MRNLLEYPVTKAEAIKYLEQLKTRELERIEEEMIMGSMAPLILDYIIGEMLK